MRAAPILFVCVLVCLSGCATAKVNSAPYSNTAYAPTDPYAVHILRDFPDSGYVKIGEISADMGITFKETDQTFEVKIRDEVARMGGDAVVVKEDEPRDRSRTDARWSTETYQDKKGHLRTDGKVEEPYYNESGRKFYGIVIKFTDGQ